MNIEKLKKRTVGLPDDMIVVVEHNGTVHNVLTAKRLRNQTRKGASEYFCIVVGKQIEKAELGR